MTPHKLTRDQKSNLPSQDSKKARPISSQEFQSPHSWTEEGVSQLDDRTSQQSPKRVLGKQVGLIRSERVFFQEDESLDSGDSITCTSVVVETGRSVDVVVDIHNENKRPEPSCVRSPGNDDSPKRDRRHSQLTGSGKLFRPIHSEEDTNVCWSAKEVPKTKMLARDQCRKILDEDKAWENEESANNIDEFEEITTLQTFYAAEPLEIITNSPLSKNDYNDSNSVESNHQLFGSNDKFLGLLTEDSVVDRDIGHTNNLRVMDAKKRRRKRWAKDERNLNLTQELIANSSDTGPSVDSDSRFSTQLKHELVPIPVPRNKKYSTTLVSESPMAFDNAAFRSDPEEVLYIETEDIEPQGSDNSQNYRRNTKIKITNAYDSYKKVYMDGSKLLKSKRAFSGALEDVDIERIEKLESFRPWESTDTSEQDNKIHKVHKDEHSQNLMTPSKSINIADHEAIFETSEASDIDDNDSKSSSYKKTRRNQIVKRKKRISGISNLPRSKSREELTEKFKDLKKSKHSRKRGTEKPESKDSTNNDLLNNSGSIVDRDDLIEYNAEKIKKFISVTIHKADVLGTDFITRHPMVKVHIVDLNTGNYLKTTNTDNNGRCSYLQPMITTKYDFKEHRSIVPNWEEELIFEYNFNEIVQAVDKPILILFEIVDLLNFSEASFNYNTLGSEGCWHKVAWAFLRPIGTSGTSHINKKVRLQLYEPSKISKKIGRHVRCEVHSWWQLTKKQKYPSTLYVTVKSVDPPIQEPILYEQLSLNELPEIEDESRGSCKNSSDLLQLPKWTRLAAQSCKIPNNVLFRSENFENGCFHLTFSNNGKYLACVCSEETNYPIIVYSIPEGQIYVQFVGHKNFVYSINWSNDDKYLLSVSSDQTACIWDMEKRIIQQTQMLPHPSYVYCGKFYPRNKSVVITGCYDSVARVWTRGKRSRHYELAQELDEHKGYVNSLSFQSDGGLITADSVGIIILWALKKQSSSSSGREWHLLKIIKITEIENIIVNTIVPHPLGGRILVHSRDNGLRMIDLATGVVLQRYKGLRNRRLQSSACLSPCGGLVLCGGEDSYLTVWNLENGRRVAKYFIQHAKIVSCVDYHPLDHILAFSTFDCVSAVQILNFDKNSTGETVGLSLMTDNILGEDAENIKIEMEFDQKELWNLTNVDQSKETCKSMSSLRKYSGKKTLNPLRRGEKLESESAKRNKMRQHTSNNAQVNEYSLSRQEFLRTKMQRLNYSEKGLKSRSAVRLNNIIEKIDEILANTTSKRDLDSTCSSDNMLKQDHSQALSNSEISIRSKDKSRKGSRPKNSRSRGKSLTLNTHVDVELHNENTELIEMRKINSGHNWTSENEESSNSRTSNSRLRSCPDTTVIVALQGVGDTSENRSVYRNKLNNKLQETISKDRKLHTAQDVCVVSKHETRKHRSSLLVDSHNRSSESCVIVLGNPKDSLSSNSISTPDSAVTYTIEKEGISKPWHPDKSKASDTSCSVESDATFTIENEISSVSRRKPGRKS